MVANRTWEIRPSGMKMGATGNLDKARACDLSRPLGPNEGAAQVTGRSTLSYLHTFASCLGSGISSGSLNYLY